MRFLVTGAAGFIGAATATELLDQGHEVVGLDAITDFYDPAIKLRNLDRLVSRAGFQFHRLDLLVDPIDHVLIGVDAIVHLAGQPGVRRSWSDFTSYVEANVQATKVVLDAAVRHGTRRVVYASSSSVYGDAGGFPTSEDQATVPASPYAITKLAGEQLVHLYGTSRGLETVSLRYFTVYGPGQRPDMLTHRLLDAAVTDTPITIFGSGRQIRDFTYVDDVARANLAAATQPVPSGLAINIAGGTSCSVNEMITTVEHLLGRPVPRVHTTAAAGDVIRTGGDTSRATHHLGWKPLVSLAEGLQRHIDSHLPVNATG